MKKNDTKNFEEIVNHLKTYGFVFPGSQIYGGLSNSWDYGPLATLVKENIKTEWINKYTKSIDDVVMLDSSILMNSKIWEASGHVKKFSDPLVDCRSCKNRYRADNLISEQLKINAEDLEESKLNKLLKDIACPKCQKKSFTDIRNFNLMFETHQGVIKDKKTVVYLRPETAQGIFVNFKNVQRSMRMKVPFGIAQIGKAFRNEITPGNFIFRTREFEQMELEYFINKNQNEHFYKELIQKSFDFIKGLGVTESKIRISKTDKNSLAHYALANSDLEYQFPFGWGEIGGVAQRGDHDLSAHQNHSKENLTYLDPKTNTKYLPYVIEPTFGLSRITLMVLVDSYTKEHINNKDRIVMKIPFKLAPYKATVLPLVSKLAKEAKNIYKSLNKEINVLFDTSGSIGKRYLRQDFIGTPFCITFDYDSLKDNKVKIRNRDTTKQERIKIKDILNYIENYEWK